MTGVQNDLLCIHLIIHLPSDKVVRQRRIFVVILDQTVTQGPQEHSASNQLVKLDLSSVETVMRQLHDIAFECFGTPMLPQKL